MHTTFFLFFATFSLFVLSSQKNSIKSVDNYEQMKKSMSKLVSVRRRRQNYYYMCGVYPFQFYSEIPCYYYDLCLNGGNRLGAPCTTSADCLIYAPSVVCYDAECCMQPIIAPTASPPTPTPSQLTPSFGPFTFRPTIGNSSIIPPTLPTLPTMPTLSTVAACNCTAQPIITKSATNTHSSRYTFYTFISIVVLMMKMF